MKEAEIRYQKRLSKFAKYRKEGTDLAFRCNKCGKLVFQSDILYGAGCTKCGCLRVCPITADLTKFGVQYCRFFNWLHEKAYKQIKKTQENSGDRAA